MEIPMAVSAQFTDRRQVKIRLERKKVLFRAMNIGENGIKRVTRGKELYARARFRYSWLSRFDEASDGHRQELVGTISDDDVFGFATVEPGKLLPYLLG